MALTGSLQLSLSLGCCGNHERSKQFQYVAGKESHHLLANRLSSRSSRQELSSVRLCASVYRPLYSLPSRYSPLRCHSFLLFGQNVPVPTMKAASVPLTKLCNALQGRTLLTNLVPATGILVFALWGLPPLMQFSRRIFQCKSDSSWTKSTENYVMTSYLQPLLLWTAGILICRTVEPIPMPNEASLVVKTRLLNFVKSLTTVLAFAYCLSSAIQQTQKYFLEMNDSSETRNMGFQFAAKAVYSAVWVAAVSLFMELLGFSTQKWLTAGGFGTVLLTLAGREIFTNFLSSAMIHATRPFVANEWIQTRIEGYDVSGTVEQVGWWSPTVIRGEDREAVHIPNHQFTVNVVRNLSQKTHWRIKTHLAISHLDTSKINSIVADMRKVLAKNPQVEQQKLHRRVFLEDINPENQAMMILISCFVKTSHREEYLCVKEAILLDLLRVIKHHRARLATPIRTIQKMYHEPDMDNISFSDSSFSRRGPTSKRPVLLIEPPYRINGEDKLKSPGRAVRTSEIQEINGSQQSTAETTVDDKVKGLSTAELHTKDKPKHGCKTDAQVAESLNGDQDSKSMASAKPQSGSENIIVEATHADHKVAGSDSTGNALKNSDNTQPKVITETQTNADKTNSPSSGSQPKHGHKSTNSEPFKSTAPALDDNIVLGVALEGSKRTLPIEEDNFSTNSAEIKEVATWSYGSGKSSGEKKENNN